MTETTDRAAHSATDTTGAATGAATRATTGATTDAAYGAYAAYEAVRLAIARGDRPGDIADLERWVPDPDGLSGAALMDRFLGTAFDPDVLFDFLAGHFDRILDTDAQQGRSRSGLFAWSCGYTGKAAVRAFETTRQARFLDLYIGFFDRLCAISDRALNRHDHVHDRVMSSWGVSGKSINARTGDGQWLCHVTPFAILMQPAAATARMIRSRADLEGYAGVADRILDFFETAYGEYDADLCTASGTDETWYRRPIADRYEPTNHVHVLGETLLDIYAATSDGRYAERIASFLRTFERSARIDADGFVAWGYHPHFTETAWKHFKGQASEPTWKASLTVPFVYAAVADGFSVDPALMAAMTRTIRQHVIAGNGMASNLHPEGSVPFLEKPRNRKSGEPAHTSCLFGFLAAAGADPAIAEQVRTIAATRRDLFPEGWLKPAETMAASRGPLGYAHMLGAR